LSKIFFSNIQLRKCQNNLIELEHKVENCNNPDRIRFLEGAEETTEDIMKKLEKVAAFFYNMYLSNWFYIILLNLTLSWK